MSDLRLNPARLAEAVVEIEQRFDVKAKEALEERAGMVVSMPESAYREELIRCEKVNEQNYNSFLNSVRVLRDSIMSVKELAEALSKRDIEATKVRESQNSAEVVDAVSALRPF